MLILILILVFLNSKPYPFFDKFEWKNLVFPLCLEADTQSILRMWLKEYRARFGRKISWLIVLSVCCSYIFIVAQSKKLNQSAKERLINGFIVPIKTFIIKKVMLQPKLWNTIKTTYKLLQNGHPFNMYAMISMYTEILFYSRYSHLLNGEQLLWSPVKWIKVLKFRKLILE